MMACWGDPGLHIHTLENQACITPPSRGGWKAQETARKKRNTEGVSLVAQWLRICLPMQGARVRALVREDPTCRGATKPVRHNY